MTVNATSSHRSALTGAALVFLAAVGFSAKAVLVKLAYAYSPGVDAITLMSLRMLLALPFFTFAALWAARSGDATELTPREMAMVGALGVLGFYLAGLLDFAGLNYISAGLERMILFLYPTLVVLFSGLFFKRAISGGQGLALLLGYAGIALVFEGDAHAAAPHWLLGSGLIFGAALSFALYVVISGEWVRRLGSTRFTAYVMLSACLATVLHFALTHRLADLNLPLRVYAVVLIMAIFCTVIPAFLLNAGMRRIGAGTTSIISSVGPVITLFLAYLLLDERLSAMQLAGTSLVIAGVLLGGSGAGSEKRAKLKENLAAESER